MRASLNHAVLAAVLLAVPVVAAAQGAITGTVRDTSGAVLPGVSVEAASPALIEKARVVVTDGSGQYRAVDLRPGTYTVTFTLQGFRTVRRQDIELTGSFTATVNAEMQVGTLEESITVTGESPIVDVQSTTQQRVFNAEVMKNVPAGRNEFAFVALVPGMYGAGSGGSNVGGAANLSRGTVTIHGSRSDDQRVMIDGLSIGNAAGAGQTSNFSPDIGSTQEVTVDYAGGAAEQGFAGPRINLIPREGGNRFSGSFFATGLNSSFQGSNYTDELRERGLSQPNRIRKAYDINPSGGGPLLADRLWFYTGARWQANENYVAGLYHNLNAGDPTRWTYEPDLSRQAVDTIDSQSGNLRLTWQATLKNKLGVYYEVQDRANHAVDTRASPEAALNYRFPRNNFGTVSWSAPLTNRLLIDVRASSLAQGWRDILPPEGDIYRRLIPVDEQSIGLIYRGAGLRVSSQPFIIVEGVMHGFAASVSYVTGAHAFKAGIEDRWGARDISYADNDFALSYRFNNGIPNQISQRATPYKFGARQKAELGLYAQDRWTFDRLTLNLGARFDYLNMYFPEQHLGPGIFVPTRDITFPQMPIVNWKNVSPRLGAVYDLFGSGRTAVKGSLGRYVLAQGLSLNPYADNANPVQRLANFVTRSWTDANGNFTPDCDLLSTGAHDLRASGGDFCGAMSNANFGKLLPSTEYDPETLSGWDNRPYNWEYSVGIQHELRPGLGIDVGYFGRSYGTFTVTDNRATTPADYDPFRITAPSDPRLPGGGGYTIEGLYNLNPTKVGLVDNYFTFASRFGEQIERWNGVDVTLNARLRQGLTMQGGVSTGRTTSDTCDIVAKIDNPSPLYCRTETPFLTQVKFLATYLVPRADVQLAATVQSLPGPQIQASYNAPNAQVQPSLGRPLSGGAANVTVNLVEPGTMYGERANRLDVRVAKLFRLRTMRTSLSLDVFNALNASSVLSQNNNFAAWQVPQSILLARFAKISVQVDF